MVGYVFVKETDEDSGGKPFLKIFPTSTYSRNCACNFGFALVALKSFNQSKRRVIIQNTDMRKFFSGSPGIRLTNFLAYDFHLL